MNRVIYLDHAATTRPYPEVVEAMLPYYREYYGNASSGYELGEDSKSAIRDARRKVAASLRVPIETIYFTSGGTEGNNWVLRKTADLLKEKGKHVITTRIEHASVLNTCKDLERQGFEITYLNVNRYGVIDLQQLSNAIRKDTILISVIYGNNEIGTLQPVREIGNIAARRRVLFHTDAVQAYGHLPLFPQTGHIDFLTASGHKFHGPKGVGFVYIRNPQWMTPLIEGGGQEMGLRSGTENVPGIVGMGEAAEISCKNIEKNRIDIGSKREYLIHKIQREIPQAIFNGHPVRRLPGNVSVCIPEMDGATLVAMLDLDGICLSSGSACSAGKKEVSHVLTAIGREEAEAKGAVRFSIGESNTREELDMAVNALKRAIMYLS